MNLYSYGPMVAGALPEWNKVTHPFGFMAENAVMEGAFALYISDGPFIYDTANGVIVPTEGAEVLQATWYNDAWSDFAVTDAAQLLVAKWTTVDIETDAGGVFLAAEDPVLFEGPLITTHEVTVDLLQMRMPAPIKAVQADHYSRNLRFTLINGGVPWTVPANSRAMICYRKADGKGGVYDAMPDGSPAFSILHNTVTIRLAPQVLTVDGIVKLSVSLECGNTKISTFFVLIDVQPNPGLEAASQDYYKLAGTLADRGWKPNYVLGTDANGFVVVKELWGNAITSSQITEDADGTLTMVNTLMDGIETIVVTPDENGNIRSINYNGKEIPISWAVSG